jgi:hypothetical protein
MCLLTAIQAEDLSTERKCSLHLSELCNRDPGLVVIAGTSKLTCSP